MRRPRTHYGRRSRKRKVHQQEKRRRSGQLHAADCEKRESSYTQDSKLHRSGECLCVERC